jgi:uncharacterized membrane protein YpjA
MGFSIGIFFILMKYARLSENICILIIVHQNLEVQTYIFSKYQETSMHLNACKHTVTDLQELRTELK